MLVQLSPWEPSRTSIRLPASNRRRKRDANDGDENKYCCSFTASMITTASKRSLSRMKIKAAEFSDCLPFLTITLDHHICVLGKNLVEKKGSSSFQEFSNLRYNSRPGDAGSFFAKPSNGASSKFELPHIPALLDTKNDRVYALQKGNIVLTSWNAWKSSGPDDISTLKIHFQSPAISMKLLPMSKGIIYGSCKNGAIYIARITGEKISVEYLQVEKPKGTVHVGTFAEIEIEETKILGRKRKISDADGSSFVNLYQVFCNSSSVKILKNKVSLSTSNSEKLIKSRISVQKTALLGLLNDEVLDQQNQYALDRVELLVSSSSYAPKISVLYTVSNTFTKSSQDKFEDPHCGTFCAAISLPSGAISNSPVRLPSKTNQFGLVSETVLAATSSEMMYIFDLITGSILQRNSLKYVCRDVGGDNEWVLNTNDKHGIISILFRKEGFLHVALSTFACDGRSVNPGSNKLVSSSKLANSLLTDLRENFKENVIGFDQGSGTFADDANSSFVFTRLDRKVARALSTLEETRQNITSEDNKSFYETSFQEVFDICLSNLMIDVNSSNNEDGALSQMEILKKGKLKGRIHSCIRETSKGRKIPMCIPQSFIDGSMQIILSIILERKKNKNNNFLLDQLGLDARYILKDLIQSKRVSARLHFEGSHALNDTGKGHPLSVALKAFGDQTIDKQLSSLQIIVEMIINCSDLSERHLVVMLDYMMRYAKADDIIDTVRRSAGTTTQEYKLMKGHEQKTIIAGVKAVLEMIMGYSLCNEAMLRVALVEELSSSTEALILARMLPNLLIVSPCDSRAKHYVISICQWISALSESYRDDLTWAKTSSGMNYLTALLNSIEKTTKNSQAVMVLKDSIGTAEIISKDKKMCIRTSVTEAPQVEEMYGYSIDHIVF